MDQIEEMILWYAGERFTPAGGKVLIESLGVDWVKITITTPKSLGERGETLTMDFDANITGKNWYDVRAKDSVDAGDSVVQTFVVRHRPGAPYI